MTFTQTFSSFFPEEKTEVTVFSPSALDSEQRLKDWAAAALSSEATNKASGGTGKKKKQLFFFWYLYKVLPEAAAKCQWNHLLPVALLCQLPFHGITTWLRFEGTSGNHLVHPPSPTGSTTADCWSGGILTVSKDVRSTASLGNPFLCLTERRLASCLNGISGISLPPPAYPPAFRYLLWEGRIAFLCELLLGCYVCSHINQLLLSLPSRRRWQYLLLVSNSFNSLFTYFLQMCEVVYANPNLKHKLTCLVHALHSLVTAFWTTFALCCQCERRRLEIMSYLFCKLLFNLVRTLLSHIL